MWLATKHGFYSIVQKPPGQYHVRARIRQDLVNLLALVRRDLEIHDWPAADYRYRIIVAQRDLGEIMAALAVSLDYTNFKNQIARSPDQSGKLDAFHEIWAILARLQNNHPHGDLQ
jgi:hypothetical protein